MVSNNSNLKCGSNNSSLELLGSLVPPLGDILLQTLLVLPPVEDSPGHLTRIALQQVSLVTPGGQESQVLAVNLDQRSSMTWVDLVSRVNTQLNLHLHRLSASEIVRKGYNHVRIPSLIQNYE